MGVAAYNRGSDHIRHEIDHRYTAHDIAVAKRTIDRENHRLANVVEEQAAELEQLRVLVAELEPLRLQVASLTAKLEVAERNADTMKDLHRQTIDQLHQRIADHEKLSGIVRLAMTPEEYHHWRQIYEEQPSDMTE